LWCVLDSDRLRGGPEDQVARELIELVGEVRVDLVHRAARHLPERELVEIVLGRASSTLRPPIDERELPANGLDHRIRVLGRELVDPSPRVREARSELRIGWDGGWHDVTRLEVAVAGRRIGLIRFRADPILPRWVGDGRGLPRARL